jgi:hypothetical protein
VAALAACTWAGEGALHVPCRDSPILTGEIGTTLKPNTWDGILLTYLGRLDIMRYIMRFCICRTKVARFYMQKDARTCIRNLQTNVMQVLNANMGVKYTVACSDEKDWKYYSSVAFIK